jgi:membrane glycosyltransferase
VFLDFLKVEGSFEEQAKQYLIKVRQDAQWIQDNLRHFIDFQIERG